MFVTLVLLRSTLALDSALTQPFKLSLLRLEAAGLALAASPNVFDAASAPESHWSGVRPTLRGSLAHPLR